MGVGLAAKSSVQDHNFIFPETSLPRLLIKHYLQWCLHPAGGAPDVATMRDCAESILQFGDAVKLYNTYIYTIVAKQIRNEK